MVPERWGRLRAARFAVSAVFFLNGFGYASWVPRIAELKAKLALSEGELGLALLMVAGGALVAMPFAGALAGRIGSRTACTIAVLLTGASFPLVALAPGLGTLALALFAVGASSGALDVVMNTQAVAVERAYRRPIMASVHGMFSLGAMAGAVAAGFIAAAGIGLFAHLVASSVLVALAGLGVCRAMLPRSADVGPSGTSFAWPARGVLVLGLIAFCALLAEGAVADWSAVYMAEVLSAGTEAAATAFAAFSLTMAAGRFAGDRLIARLGAARVVQAGGVLALAGLGAVLLLKTPAAAVVGFGLIGAGIACTFPIVLSAAARISDLPAGTAIAAVCTIGYLGLLAGPPVIGFAAELVGLTLALGLLACLFALILVFGRRVQPAEGSRHAEGLASESPLG